MAIKFVKVKRNITVGSNPGEKYLARLFRGTDVSIDQIANEISEATTVSYPDVLACLKAMETHILKYILAGQAVKLSLLGSFIPFISAKAMNTAEEVTADTIKRAGCRFFPSVNFKQAMKKCKFLQTDMNIAGLQQQNGKSLRTYSKCGEPHKPSAFFISDVCCDITSKRFTLCLCPSAFRTFCLRAIMSPNCVFSFSKQRKL